MKVTKDQLTKKKNYVQKKYIIHILKSLITQLTP